MTTISQQNDTAVLTVLAIDGEKKIGTFIRRLNRFAAEVLLDGVPTMAYIPNTGRMSELLVPGYPVLLARRPHSIGHKSHYDLLMVQTEAGWVSIDSRVPNRLLRLALSQENLGCPFASYKVIKHEATFEDSRLDFLLAEDERRCYLEAKSVNLVRDGLALFPDAPTTRGRRHLDSLCSAKSQGFEAALVFIIQREDAESFSPNDTSDPAFGISLRKAADAGVGIYAYRCRITPENISVLGPVPILL